MHISMSILNYKCLNLQNSLECIPIGLQYPCPSHYWKRERGKETTLPFHRISMRRRKRIVHRHAQEYVAKTYNKYLAHKLRACSKHI